MYHVPSWSCDCVTKLSIMCCTISVLHSYTVKLQPRTGLSANQPAKHCIIQNQNSGVQSKGTINRHCLPYKEAIMLSSVAKILQTPVLPQGLVSSFPVSLAAVSCEWEQKNYSHSHFYNL